MAVKETGAHEPAVKGDHVAVDHVAGTMGVREIESEEEDIPSTGSGHCGFGGEFDNGFQSGSGQGVLRPGEEGGDTLAKVFGRGAAVDVPHHAGDGRKQVLIAFLTAVTDAEESMQEAFENDNGGEERLPGVLGRFPAVCVEGLGGVGGRQLLRFVAKTTIGVGQCSLVRRRGHGCTQDTIGAHGHGNVGLLAVDMDVLLVRQQVLGEMFGVFDRRTHEIVASETGGQPIPVGVIMAEHVAKAPEGDAEATQEQGLLYLIGVADHLRQHAAARNRQYHVLTFLIRLLELDAPKSHTG